MEVFTEEKFCKYCERKLEVCLEEGLECSECKSNVHLKCLKRGSVPGGLYGDIFFTFTCQECSPEGTEIFSRIELTWLQVIVLVLYHLQNKSPGLGRKGFFHWRHHITQFTDKNWSILFPSETKRKKKWTGTIAGTLSSFRNFIFLSGNDVLKTPAIWALKYPKLTPHAISCVYSVMMIEKQNLKNQKQTQISDADLFHTFVCKCIIHDECLQVFTDTQTCTKSNEEVCDNSDLVLENIPKLVKRKRKRTRTTPQIPKKFTKLSHCESVMPVELPSTSASVDFVDKLQISTPSSPRNDDANVGKFEIDPQCHFNTCMRLNSISTMKNITLHTKLKGGVRPDHILSPYSGIYLKPYIWRDMKTFPTWLRLMAEVQIVANRNVKGYDLPPRDGIYYSYVRPEHMPAINSLCNQFFWPGIDLTETLQYPDFTCVALYKRLIVGFAVLVPDVKYIENYLSYIFTRPHWRNCGIAKFMLNHLIQASQGKDITLHVAIDNPALLLYQKLGFKVESVVRGFYDMYLRSDSKDCKHAFFCRLER